jgi:hypothetical protein
MTVNLRKIDNTMAPKMIKWRTMIYKALDRKLKIAQHEPNLKPGLNSGAPEGIDVHVPLAMPSYYYI